MTLKILRIVPVMRKGHDACITEREVDVDAGSEKLMDELRAVVEAAEKLLGATAAQGDEALQEARARAETALRAARSRLDEAGHELEEQVRRHPFAALVIAAALGVVIGVLLARK
jgi:ElaB/YqjD/DUF883 family membrane-anchored ribosome-binding protein